MTHSSHTCVQSIKFDSPFKYVHFSICPFLPLPLRLPRWGQCYFSLSSWIRLLTGCWQRPFGKIGSIMTRLLQILQWCPSLPTKTQESLECHLASRNPVFYSLLPSIHTHSCCPSGSNLAAGSQTHWDLCIKHALPDMYRTDPPLFAVLAHAPVFGGSCSNSLPTVPSAPIRLSVPFTSSCSRVVVV